MPPASDMRKSGGATMTLSNINDPAASRRRTTSGRAVRANTTRPFNYYARAGGSFSAANPPQPLRNDAHPGFYPGVQYFTDAVTALPKEVMRQFTLVREVEAKIHGANEQIGELIDTILEYPVPAKKDPQPSTAVPQGLLSFTAHNSTSGSANASLINGMAPPSAGTHSAQNSIAGSLNGDDSGTQAPEEEVARKQTFLDLKMHLQDSLANLDEKNGLLAEANRVLSHQLMRIDAVMPLVESEISEEARLGSMTHWAYSDNRQRKPVADISVNRRNVAATNNLAAAAHAVHESEIQQARRDATRDTARDKPKSRAKDLDSDFDDKPRKPNPKIAKLKSASTNALNSSSSNGEPSKKRRIDKALAAPVMERTLSGNIKPARAHKEASKSAPPTDPIKKPAKPKTTVPKKRGVNSAQASPAIPSSPLAIPLALHTTEIASVSRPQCSRARQSSVASNVKNDKPIEEPPVPAPVVPETAPSEKSNGKRKLAETAKETPIEAESVNKSTEPGDEPINNDDVEMADGERPQISRSTSTSAKGGANSKTGTPRNEQFSDAPAMLRTRSTRSTRPNGRDDSSSEPLTNGRSGHRREMSNSHLVKQLAPFNRSPDLGRHLNEGEEDLDAMGNERDGRFGRSPRKRPSSRRNTGAALLGPIPSSPHMATSRPENSTTPTEPEPLNTGTEIKRPDFSPIEPSSSHDIEVPAQPTTNPATATVAENIVDEPEDLLEDDGEDEEDDEDSEPGDPDDPNEPRYCYCNRGSYGEMIACDNDDCPREWFHLGCTDLSEAPNAEDQWYCADCQPLFVQPRRGGRGGRSTR